MDLEQETIFDAYWQGQVMQEHDLIGTPVLRLPAPDYFTQVDRDDEGEAVIMGLMLVMLYPEGVYTVEYRGYGMKLLKSGKPGKKMSKFVYVPARRVKEAYRTMLISQAKPDLSRIKS